MPVPDAARARQVTAGRELVGATSAKHLALPDEDGVQAVSSHRNVACAAAQRVDPAEGTAVIVAEEDSAVFGPRPPEGERDGRDGRAASSIDIHDLHLIPVAGGHTDSQPLAIGRDQRRGVRSIGTGNRVTLSRLQAPVPELGGRPLLRDVDQERPIGRHREGPNLVDVNGAGWGRSQVADAAGAPGQGPTRDGQRHRREGEGPRGDRPRLSGGTVRARARRLAPGDPEPRVPQRLGERLRRFEPVRGELLQPLGHRRRHVGRHRLAQLRDRRRPPRSRSS